MNTPTKSDYLKAIKICGDEIDKLSKPIQETLDRIELIKRVRKSFAETLPDL